MDLEKAKALLTGHHATLQACAPGLGDAVRVVLAELEAKTSRYVGVLDQEIKVVAPRNKGTVDWYLKSKRYGMISDDKGGGPILIINCDLNLKTGTKVSYYLQQRDSGKIQAIDIKVL